MNSSVFPEDRYTMCLLLSRCFSQADDQGPPDMLKHVLNQSTLGPQTSKSKAGSKQEKRGEMLVCRGVWTWPAVRTDHMANQRVKMMKNK